MGPAQWLVWSWFSSLSWGTSLLNTLPCALAIARFSTTAGENTNSLLVWGLEVVSSGLFFPCPQVFSWHPCADHYSAEDSGPPLQISGSSVPLLLCQWPLAALAFSDSQLRPLDSGMWLISAWAPLPALGPGDLSSQSAGQSQDSSVLFVHLSRITVLFWLLSDTWEPVDFSLFVFNGTSFLVTTVIQMLVSSLVRHVDQPQTVLPEIGATVYRSFPLC